MINNLELNKDKLGKLTRKVILVGGIISTLLTGGCKTKENSSTNQSITEVTPTPTETPDVASDNEQEEYKYYKIDFTVKVYNGNPEVIIESEKEVEYQNTETPTGGFVNVTFDWEPVDHDSMYYIEGRNYMRFRRQFLIHRYFDYDQFMYTLENMNYIDSIFDNFINTEIDEYYTAGSGEKFVAEIPQGEEDFFMLQGYVNVRKKVKTKTK